MENGNELTDHEKSKIRKQIDEIQNQIKFLHWHREQLKQGILNEIPAQSKKTGIGIQEKAIDLDWGDTPEEYVNVIKDCRLDRRVHMFGEVSFQMHPVLSKGIAHYISDLYNTLNYISNLVVFAHPSRIVGRTIGDNISSLIKNGKVLSGRLSDILVRNKKWIDDFKDMRKVDEHKSPIDFHIVFEMMTGEPKVSFLLRSNYTKKENDLFVVFGYLEKIEMLFDEINEEIAKML